MQLTRSIGLSVYRMPGWHRARLGSVVTVSHVIPSVNTIKSIMVEWPIDEFGLWCGHQSHQSRCGHLECGYPERFTRGQEALLSYRSRVHVGQVMSELSGCVWTPATKHSPGSYSLKHTMESYLKHYVSNGQLILSCLLIGVPIRPYDQGNRPSDPHHSPNATIGISRYDEWRMLRDAGHLVGSRAPRRPRDIRTCIAA